MNLTFGICWIEDQASEVEIAAVESAVQINGFEPEIRRVETEEEIRDFSRQQEQYQDFDLILLDLKLGHDLKGDEIAPHIRQSFRSTPILFYSAEPEDRLRRLMAHKGVEGVYCAHRTNLSERVRELVTDLSPALNRLSGMRGLAAGVVADCDQEFRTILRHWAAKGTVAEADLVTSLKERVHKSKDRTLKHVDEAEDLGTMLDSHAVTSAVLVQEVLGRLRNFPMPDEILVKRRSLRQYPDKVLKRRNTLAHGVEKRTPDGLRIYRDDSKPPLTVQDFQTYRSEFLTHLGNVRELRELLISQESD